MIPKILLAAALALVAAGCTRISVNPGAGSETILVRSLEHGGDWNVEYLRDPAQGPIAYEANVWSLLWNVPLNHPDFGLWLRRELPPGTEAANIAATVRKPWWGYLLFVPTLGLVDVNRVRFEAQPVKIGRAP